MARSRAIIYRPLRSPRCRRNVHEGGKDNIEKRGCERGVRGKRGGGSVERRERGEKKAWKDEGSRAWVTREVRFRGVRYTRGKINFPSLVKSLVKAEITRVMGKSGEVTK